jgi:hypothetical protein
LFGKDSPTQVFNEPVRTEGHDDGIRLYLKVINEFGPDQQTQAWIHQQSLEEKYAKHKVDGIRGFVRRYQGAYGELELLGKKYKEAPQDADGEERLPPIGEVTIPEQVEQIIDFISSFFL